jgi:hypothetical protein
MGASEWQNTEHTQETAQYLQARGEMQAREGQKAKQAHGKKHPSETLSLHPSPELRKGKIDQG